MSTHGHPNMSSSVGHLCGQCSAQGCGASELHALTACTNISEAVASATTATTVGGPWLQAAMSCAPGRSCCTRMSEPTSKSGPSTSCVAGAEVGWQPAGCGSVCGGMAEDAQMRNLRPSQPKGSLTASSLLCGACGLAGRMRRMQLLAHTHTAVLRWSWLNAYTCHARVEHVVVLGDSAIVWNRCVRSILCVGTVTCWCLALVRCITHTPMC